MSLKKVHQWGMLILGGLLFFDSVSNVSKDIQGGNLLGRRLQAEAELNKTIPRIDERNVQDESSNNLEVLEKLYEEEELPVVEEQSRRRYLKGGGGGNDALGVGSVLQDIPDIVISVIELVAGAAFAEVAGFGGKRGLKAFPFLKTFKGVGIASLVLGLVVIPNGGGQQASGFALFGFFNLFIEFTKGGSPSYSKLF